MNHHTTTITRPSPVRRTIIGLLAAAVLTLVAASPASAGTYTWNICSAGIAVGSAASGDHVSVHAMPGANATTCWANNGNISKPAPNGHTAYTTVHAPDGAKIIGNRLQAYGNNYSWGNGWGYNLFDDATSWGCHAYANDFRGTCGPGSTGFNTVNADAYATVPAGSDFSVMGIYCANTYGCGTGTLDEYIQSWSVTVQDSQPPDPTVGGDLWTSAPVKDTVPLTYAVTDNAAGGAGIKVLIDGARVADTTGSDGGGCSNDTWKHCPDDSGTVQVPLTGIGDGSHTLTVNAYDSVGNASTTARQIFIDQAPPSVTDLAVTGSPVEGQSLACTATVTGQSPTTTYQWIRTGPDGSNPFVIPAATSTTYRLTSSDVGKKILCRVTGTDHGGSTTATTTITSGPFENGATVTAAPAPAPATTTTTTTTPSSGAAATSTPAPALTAGGTGGDHASATTAAPSSDGQSTASNARGTDDATLRVLTPSNGTNATQTATVHAAWSLGGKGSKATIDYGYKPTIRGTVVNAAGTPIVGAQVDVIAQSVVAGSKPVAKTGLITRAGGQFTYKLPSGVDSRTITFRYRPSLASSVVGGQAAVQLKVRAGLQLSTSRGGRVRSSSPTFRFTGRLLGPGVKGQLVEIRVKKSRSWVVVGKPVRVSADGQFRLRYTVAGRMPSGTVFTFRATSRASKGYGYLTGSSQLRNVKVI